MTEANPTEPAGRHPLEGRDIGRKAAAVGLLFVIVVALALRMYGLDWDEGFSWTPHPDERAILSKVDSLSPPSLGKIGVLLDPEESPWNPRWFPYGSFPLYLLKGASLIYNLLPLSDLSDLRTMGRAISGLVDVVTVGTVYTLGTLVHTRRVGLLAAGMTALAVIHVQLSHFFAVDTFLALFAVLSMYFLVRVARHGNGRDSALAGLFVGLGLATKVSLAPIGAAYVVAHLMYAFGLLSGDDSRAGLIEDRVSTALKNGVLGVSTMAVTFFIAQPYAVLDWGRFYADLTEQSEMVRRIRDYPYTRQYIDTTPYLYQIRQHITWGLGWPLGVLAWAGMLYAGFRGLGFGGGLLYAAVGWALPMAILLASNGYLGMFTASAVSVGALLASMPFRRTETRAEAFLISWVAPYFLITGTFEVKFLRYLIPITPFLLLFGSRLTVDLVRSGTRPHFGAAGRVAGSMVTVAIALGLTATAFYSLAYLGVYGRDHPAVSASEWINVNAPKYSVVLREHWEESLPDLGRYQNRELQLYEPDTSTKLRTIGEELSGADYLVFYSNRLYGTIPRLPERYPTTSRYYEALFAGKLGFELGAHFESHPRLLGVSFVDDTFSRPGLPVPAGVDDAQVSPVVVGMGFADESFSVYDHPRVLVFRNVERLSPDDITAHIQAASGGYPMARDTVSTAPTSEGAGLMLSPQAAEVQQSGGTWTEIVREDGWVSRAPVVGWLVVVEGIALLAFPIAFFVFRPLPDRGWMFAKALGLLLVGLVVWMLASLHWMEFSRVSVAVGLVLLFPVSVLALVAQRDAIKEFFARRWRTITVAETVFITAFLVFLVIRMANPDLWHPYRGGEKPMDLAYLIAVMKSTYMPPYDPWFGGGYMNYYYWGQFLVATLIHATGIGPDLAVNLAVPLFFALTFGLTFSLVFNLAEGARRRLGRAAPGIRTSPVLAGLAGGFFVTVLGNLDGAVQLGQGAYRLLAQGLPFGEFDFWRSSRMMPPDPPGHEITEFPFFTFLFGDPHAHLLALPFTLLALGISLAVVLGAVSRRGSTKGWGAADIVRLGVLGIAVGSLRLLNTWDYPTYLAIAAGAVAIGEILAHGGLTLAVGARWAVKTALVFLTGYAAFLPYHLAYETFFDSVQRTTNTTVLWQFLAITGLFVFVTGSYYIRALRGPLLAAGRQTRCWTARLLDTLAGDGGRPSNGDGYSRVSVRATLLAVAGAVAVGYLLTAMLSGFGGGTLLLASLLALSTAFVGVRALARRRPDTPQVCFVSTLVGAAFLLVLGLDVVRVEGDIDRMNSVFKFYLQVWVLLAIGAAYLLWRLIWRDAGARNPGFGGRGGKLRGAWTVALAVLLLSAAVYPVLGTQDRLRDRFENNVTPLTLDGTAYIEGATYRDAEGEVDLAADFEGIRWLRSNVEGSPIVLEANTPTYRWGGRVSIYTGLPGIVGWQWHQEQQRWDYRADVGRRINDVRRIFATHDPSEAMELLQEYDVKYIYLGQLERLYYPAEGIAKFTEGMSSYLEPVFEGDKVSIYRVNYEGF